MVFVTGATGFLGSYLVKYLVDQGFPVRALKRKSSRMDLLGAYADRIEWIEGDILDVFALEDAMQNVSNVYHAAALVSFAPRERKKMYKINVEGTANVFNIALRSGIDKILYVSSVAAFGRSSDNQTIDESTEWVKSKHNSHYAITKYLAEREAWRGKVEGLNTIVVNPSTILGAGFWNSSTGKMFERVYDGLSFYTPGVNGFVDVRDVASIMVRLMNSDISGEQFIISAGNYSFLEILSKIATALGKKEPTIKAGDRLSQIVIITEKIRSLISGTDPLITSETARLGSATYLYDNQKIMDTLNYSFKPIDEVIKETAQLFLKSQTEQQKFATFF